MTIQANRIGASLERAMRHWRERGALLRHDPPQEFAHPISIAISRQRGAGGLTIAKAVADELEWQLYDRELVEAIAENTGVRTELLDQLDEHRPDWVAELLQGVSEEKPISGAGYAVQLRRILLGLYYHGNCVVVGRGAAQLLPPHRTVRVAIVAPRTHRIERMTEQLGDPKAATTHVDRTDADRIAFVKKYYQKDPNDLEQYDLVLDTSTTSVDDCVKSILAAVEHKRLTLPSQDS